MSVKQKQESDKIKNFKSHEWKTSISEYLENGFLNGQWPFKDKVLCKEMLSSTYPAIQWAAVTIISLNTIVPPQECLPLYNIDTWYGASFMSISSPPTILASSMDFRTGDETETYTFLT